MVKGAERNPGVASSSWPPTSHAYVHNVFLCMKRVACDRISDDDSSCASSSSQVESVKHQH